MGAILGFLPIIGPIIQGLFSTVSGIYSKWQDTKLGTLTVQRQQDTEEAKVSAQIIHDTQDSIGLRLMRDLVCFPVVVWSTLIGWDTIVAIRYHDLMFHVEKYPDSVSYIPYAVMVFLLGNIGINMWSRR